MVNQKRKLTKTKVTDNNETTQSTEPPLKSAKLQQPNGYIAGPSKKSKATAPKAARPTQSTRVQGMVLTVGEGEVGQLGKGPDVVELSQPKMVKMPGHSVVVCAGGMHSVCVTDDGKVYTFGCNDDGALGRSTPDDDEATVPDQVKLDSRIVQVSAGDSHTAALTEDGRVFIWGTFRDSNGVLGISPTTDKLETPTQIMTGVKVTKLASGCDHLVCLTDAGIIYTLGAAEQGQLGRVAEYFSHRGGRRGKSLLLEPGQVCCARKKLRFSDIWAGQYSTFAKARDTGEIYSWGLNNYYQIGFPDDHCRFQPEKCSALDPAEDWKEISGGQHHALALTKTGKVFSFGRSSYGRLGLPGPLGDAISVPTMIPSLSTKQCVQVECGNCVSFAVTVDGKVYSWGMGDTKQLGHDDEDDVSEPMEVNRDHLNKKRCMKVSSGGQHTMFLVENEN